MLEKIIDIFRRSNQQGIFIPMISDPSTGKSSVSLTIFFIANTVVTIGLIGKWSNALGGVDLTQALYWWGMAAALYAQRKYVKSKDSLTIEEKENNDP